MFLLFFVATLIMVVELVPWTLIFTVFCNSQTVSMHIVAAIKHCCFYLMFLFRVSAIKHCCFYFNAYCCLYYISLMYVCAEHASKHCCCYLFFSVASIYFSVLLLLFVQCCFIAVCCCLFHLCRCLLLSVSFRLLFVVAVSFM